MLAVKLGLVLVSVALCLGGKAEYKNVLARDGMRIVGGELAGAAEFPFLASLQFFGSHYCGCTILNNEWVLTAAHCIYGNDLSGYTVISGTNNWVTGGVTHTIVEGEYHAEYINNAYWPNDIAVLRVDPPFEFSATTQAVVLAAAGTDVSNETPSVVSGWGAEQFGGSVTEDMKRADVMTYDDTECLSQYDGEGPTEFHICAGGGGTGVCGGDSGGPLLVDGVQVGITSWGRVPCASIAGVWTQVSYFRDWILERTGA